MTMPNQAQVTDYEQLLDMVVSHKISQVWTYKWS